jgi:hypothetical protein
MKNRLPFFVAMLVALLALPVLAQTQAQEIRSTFVRLGAGVPGVLYEPVTPGPKAEIGLLVMHPDNDYLQFAACTELSKRGYRVLCANSTASKSGTENDLSTDRVLLEAKLGVAWLRKYSGIRKVVLLGNSGGGVLLSSYQLIAEGGLKACQGPEKILKCPDTLAGLPAADGLMIVNSNYGSAMMSLLSLDPAIMDEGSGMKVDPQLDVWNPANGFDARNPKYTPEFTQRFQAAVAKRETRLIQMARDRLQKIDAGQGRFADDEPFVVPGAATNPPNNKFFTQDPRFLSHTHKAWPLLHKDGSFTTEIVRSPREPTNLERTSPLMSTGALKTTVRRFLGNYAIRVSDDFGYDEDSIRGVDWASAYTVPAGNVQGIHAPLLTVGVPGRWEFLCAEIIHEHAASADKTLIFVESADTTKALYDYLDGWLSKPGRF